jgi:hypothetical protein
MALKGELAKPSFYGFIVSSDERSLIYSQFDRPSEVHFSRETFDN